MEQPHVIFYLIVGLYMLSSERLVDIKISNFYVEKVVPRARRYNLKYILQAVTFFP
jgi:hypothetical protein